MLSEIHNNNIISYFLSKWLHNKLMCPKVCVTDLSLALQMACVKSFTQYSSLDMYLRVCSAFLMNNHTTYEVPFCMLRADIAHVMHIFSKWTKVKEIRLKRVKGFYMHCLALLVKSTDYRDVKVLLHHIFTTALNTYEGENTISGDILDCEVSKTYLKRLISGHATEHPEWEDIVEERESDALSLDIVEEESIDKGDEQMMKRKKDENFFHEIEAIFRQCKENSEAIREGTRDNSYYNPKLAEKICAFCTHLPIWSAIMIQYFGYGGETESSATSESLFKELKRDAFQHEKLPLRLDNFLLTHINFLNGASVLLGSAKNVKEEEECKSDENVEKPLHQHEAEVSMIASDEKISGAEHSQKEELQSEPKELTQEEEEDWKGLNTSAKQDNRKQKSKPRRRPNYLQPNPSIILVNENQSQHLNRIGLLKNGSSSDLLGIQIDSHLYCITNTCAFDSLVQVLLTAYADSDTVREFIKRYSEDVPFFSLISSCIVQGITPHTYKNRARILLGILPETAISDGRGLNTVMVNAACTLTFLITSFFQKFLSYAETTTCSECGGGRKRDLVSITVHFEAGDSLSALSHLLDIYMTNPMKCDHCGCTLKNRNILLGDIIFIETCLITTKFCKIPHPCGILNDVPKIFTFSGKPSYYLRGLLVFKPPNNSSSGAIGHYIAYCYRYVNNEWYRYNDLESSPHQVR